MNGTQSATTSHTIKRRRFIRICIGIQIPQPTGGYVFVKFIRKPTESEFRQDPCPFGWARVHKNPTPSSLRRAQRAQLALAEATMLEYAFASTSYQIAK